MAVGLPLAVIQELEGAAHLKSFCKGCNADVYKSWVFLERDNFTPAGSHCAQV